MTPQELLNANGIDLDSYDPGEHSSTCPKCSHKRKLAHQETKCLSVKVDAREQRGTVTTAAIAGHPRAAATAALIHEDKNFVAKYNYIGFQKVRYSKGHKPPFRIRHRAGTGWKWGAGGADTGVLYRIEEVKKAIALGRRIAVVEGEKD